MAQKRIAEKPFTLTRSGDDELTMSFDIHTAPPGGWSTAGPAIGSAMIILGFFPGILLAGLVNYDEPSIGVMAFGWITAIILPFVMAWRSFEKKKAPGSRFRRLIFTPDSVTTTSDEILDRGDIDDVFWMRPDTSFTYSSNTEQSVKQANANHRYQKALSVGMYYGSQPVMLTHPTLTENQARKMADAVTRWIDAPEDFVRQAETT